MSKKNKKNKIATDGACESLVDNPFAGLSADGLPPAKHPPVASTSAKKPEPKKRGRVDIRREKSGRGGKWVTVVAGEGFLHIAPRELETLLQKWKGQCACGGTIKGKVLEIQGDQRDYVARELTAMGYRTVLVGG